MTKCRSNHLHVNVPRLCMGKSRKQRLMCCEFYNCGKIRTKIPARTFGHFSDLDQKRNGTGPNTYKPNGQCDDVAEHMLLNFSESGHPAFRGTSALERGTLRSKGGGKLSIHFCGDSDTAELIFRTVVCFRQSAQYLRCSSGYV